MYRWFLLPFLMCPLWGDFQQGIQLFEAQRYEEALIVFQDPNDQSLLGQLYCHVALGQDAEIDEKTRLITQSFRDMADCNKLPDERALKMETREEHLITYQCRRNIRELANEMRQTVEQIVRETVKGFFRKIQLLRKLYPFIDDLEQIGIDCCQSGKPSECCLLPMREQLESWKALGIKPD